MLRALIALAVLLPASASAQRGRPVAERGDLALVASIPGIDVLRLNPTVGGIGLRYRVADRTVVGASVGLRFDTFDEDRGGVSGEVTRRSVGLTLWNENHVGRGLGPVSPFVGAGLTFGVGDERVEREATPCDPFTPCPGPLEGYRDATSSTTFGAGALLGAEVRVARGVTLGAAYVLGVEVSRFRYERERTDVPGVENGSGNNVRAGSGVTDVQLSVYF